MKYILCSIILFSCYSMVKSANLPEDIKIEPITDFSGGLNTNSPANKIPKNFSPNMENVFIHRNPGKLVKRNGFIQVGNSTITLANVRFMFTFYKEDGSKEFIVSDDSVVLTTQDFKTYTLIISTLNNSVHLQAAQIRNKVWFTNGSDSIFTWDGSVMQKLDGGGSTPNVPKFRYITFFQERVFGLNTSANGSALNWSDVASTAGAAIAPDSYLAWPAANSLSIGQGDGELGTALWVYQGQLQIGKERSIYSLFGTNTSNYNARKEESWVGPTSQDSIAVIDNLTYFKGFDGIYSYDGVKATRISDDISPNITAILDANTQIVSDIWETQSDFDKGQYFGITSTGNPGVIQPATEIKIVVPTGGWLGTGAGNPPLDSGTTSYTAFVNFGNNVSSSARFYTSQIQIGGQLQTSNIRVIIYNAFTGVRYHSTYTFTNGNFSVNIASQEPVFDGLQVNQSTYNVKLEFVSGTGGSVQPLITNWSFTLNPATTGQFISQMATATTITAWSNFDSIRNTNGGSINYYTRASNSVANVATQTWQSISPGVVIPFNTGAKYIQWASTITSVSSYTNITNIDNVSIAHIQGAGSRDRPFAISWNKEYWLSVATESSGNFSLQYVKSWITNPNPNAWMLMRGMNLRSLTKDGNTTLYGGSASSGTVYRLDYGTNDNGTAIDGFYETPDLILNGNWREAKLHEIWTDIDGETNNTFRLGLSINGGAYSEQTMDMSGSVRQLKTFYNQNKFAKFFRLRFRNNQLDHSLGLNNAAIIYENLFTR